MFKKFLVKNITIIFGNNILKKTALGVDIIPKICYNM